MKGFNHHPHTNGLKNVVQAVGDLFGQALLDLQAAAERIDNPGNFAYANYFPLWQIGDMTFANEGKHMVFAHAEHVNILDNNHFIIVFLE